MINQWLTDRTESERRILAAAAVLLLVLLVGLFIRPVYASLRQNEIRVARQYIDLDQMKEIVRTSSGGVSTRRDPAITGSLVIILQESARREGLSIATMQPIGTQSINTRLNDVSFEAMMRWLAALESQGVSVQTASIRSGQQDGTVDTSLLLTRN
jgi:general secretion pathway protein M